jgi:hypothetical protein
LVGYKGEKNNCDNNKIRQDIIVTYKQNGGREDKELGNKIKVQGTCRKIYVTILLEVRQETTSNKCSFVFLPNSWYLKYNTLPQII